MSENKSVGHVSRCGGIPYFPTESLYDEMCIHKDKYYQSKKSAYIKMALQLGMMEDMHIDSQLVTEFKKIIDSNIITISG